MDIIQRFSIRGDMRCGSTIGPITASHLGVRTIDIGSPQLVDSLGHSFLQLILDSSGASKIETLLNQLSSILDQVLAIDETSRGIEVYFLPA